MMIFFAFSCVGVGAWSRPTATTGIARRNPNCELWTNGEQKCSRTGGNSATSGATDPKMPAEKGRLHARQTEISASVSMSKNDRSNETALLKECSISKVVYLFQSPGIDTEIFEDFPKRFDETVAPSVSDLSIEDESFAAYALSIESKMLQAAPRSQCADATTSSLVMLTFVKLPNHHSTNIDSLPRYAKVEASESGGVLKGTWTPPTTGVFDASSVSWTLPTTRIFGVGSAG